MHGYEEWGTDVVCRLNGMFGIALHDISDGTVLLARDHLGIKPLYFAFQQDKLIFGSEIKALLATDWIARDINFTALADFMSWEYVPGRDTLFTGIEKLLPGEILSFKCARPLRNPQKFWDIPAATTADCSISFS